MMLQKQENDQRATIADDPTQAVAFNAQTHESAMGHLCAVLENRMS